METGKEIIMKYCRKTGRQDISHIENCVENLGYLENNEIDKLEGCPSNYGLNYYVGVCERDGLTSTNTSSKELVEKCKECWEIALNKKY
jgi:hypothetical protein